MKILNPTALLAGVVMFLTVLVQQAACQEGLQPVEDPADSLQAVPDEAAPATPSQAGCDCGCQDGAVCGSRVIGGRPRALIGRSRGCGGAPGGFTHLGAGMAGLGSAMHSGQPLIDPWARADWIASQQAMGQSWHAGYSHTGWGAPVALIVPPTARMQTRMGWGVSQSTMSPIYHQFERPYPSAPGAGGTVVSGPCLPLQSTPRWPSHTDQFGVYYVRGPW